MPDNNEQIRSSEEIIGLQNRRANVFTKLMKNFKE